jgi:hypothetical protein
LNHKRHKRAKREEMEKGKNSLLRKNVMEHRQLMLRSRKQTFSKQAKDGKD